MSPTASSTYDGQQHLWCVCCRTAAAALRGCGDVQLQQDCYSSCCDGAFLRSCTVGNRVLPEFLSQKLHRLVGFRRLSVNRQVIVRTFYRLVEPSWSVERTLSISRHRVSTSSIHRASLRPAAVQAVGVAPCIYIYIYS